MKKNGHFKNPSRCSVNHTCKTKLVGTNNCAWKRDKSFELRIQDGPLIGGKIARERVVRIFAYFSHATH